MKIAWFTPFTKKSAIGMISKQIAEELSKQHMSVDIWCDVDKDIIETSVNIIHYSADTININVLDTYDFTIYNLGNYLTYHYNIYRVMKKHKGIVIFHDQTMGSFWWQLFFNRISLNEDILDYQDEYRLIFGNLLEYKNYTFSEFLANCRFDFEKMPIEMSLRPFLKYATGIFTHAMFFLDSLKDISNIPMEFSYLPCSEVMNREINNEMDNQVKLIMQNAKKEKRKIIVSNGIVQSVKRIDKIVSVLLQESWLQSKICYIVIGSYSGSYGEMLENYSKNELQGCLFMMGYQDYDTMFYVIKNANLCINLRYPNSEVCSLSLLEQMAFSKPVLVLDSGIYGEMPDNAVVKIDLNSESLEIEKVLKKLVVNEEAYEEIGKNAGEFIRKYCSIKSYVQKLTTYLNDFHINKKVSDIQDNFITTLLTRIDGLFGSLNDTPATFSNTIRGIEYLFGGECFSGEGLSVIGVWAGYWYKVGDLSQESTSIFMSYIMAAMIKRYRIKLEVWCYADNQKAVERIFEPLLLDENYSGFISIITEKNWARTLNVDDLITCDLADVNIEKDNLNLVAYRFSKADIMIPMTVYLDNVIGCGKPVYIPLNDINVAAKYEDLTTPRLDGNAHFKNTMTRTENMVRSGAKFFCNSNYVLNTQVLKYIKSLTKDRTEIVYLPVNIPDGILEKILPEIEIRKKFKIDGSYFFYATQVRFNKNFTTLVKAINIIHKKGSKVKLVITGNINDVPEVMELIMKYNLENYIISLESLSEPELFSLYRYSAGAPVFEGGFSQQANVGLFMDAPVVLPRFEGTIEIIEHCGFTEKNCGLKLVNPMVENEFAEVLEFVLRNREKVVREQSLFKNKLLLYTWDAAAKEYYQFFYNQKN